MPTRPRPSPPGPARARRGRLALIAACLAAPLLPAFAQGASAPASSATPAPASAAPTPSASTDGVQFAPGWEEHTRPLIFHGIASHGDRTMWMVPATLPKGTYRVITRLQGRPQLVDGQRFTVGSDAYREINLLLSNFDQSPEAIDERWVILPGATPTAR